jgi:hypothetical protein
VVLRASYNELVKLVAVRLDPGITALEVQGLGYFPGKLLDCLLLPSASFLTTSAPKETVLRRFEAVPGVKRIPVGLDGDETCNGLSGVTAVGNSLAPVPLLRLVLWYPSSSGVDFSSVFSMSWGVPNIAVLKARIANTGAGVSGASGIHVVSLPT